MRTQGAEGDEGFPAQWGRTRRLSLGIPRDFTISDGGDLVAFLRTRSGSDPCSCLWLLDVMTGAERLLVDPAQVDVVDEAPPAEERARRERAREASTGIVRYSSDLALRRVVFDLGGRVFRVDTRSGAVLALPVREPAADPRLDPGGGTVAYVSGGSLRVIGADGSGDRALLEPENSEVAYGLAEFVAAEEMGRQEGYWWSPDGARLAVARVDASPVQRWFIADPASPDQPPLQVAYPVAGSANARVTLTLVDLEGSALPVRWDQVAFEYLVASQWSKHGLLLVVQTRDQRRLQVLDVDLGSGATSLVREDTDADWVDIVRGVPARLERGALVWTADSGDAKQLLIEDAAVTGPELQVREVLDVDGDVVLFTASSEPTAVEVWTWSPDDGPAAATPIAAGPAVRTARRAGGTTVVVTRALEDPAVEASVHRGGNQVARIESVAERPAVDPRPHLCRLGERDLRAALLWPTGYMPGRGRLPVLLDPYAGPGHQRVLAAAGMYLESQWFADHGFAVLVIDGRGTPGRGPSWERSVRGEMTRLPLEDQVDGLHAAAARWPDLDLSRVAIRGWSYGGELAALALLRRPDVFHVAVAGAPVTDSHLYDTHYTERYLGHPEVEPENYERTSLVLAAPQLERPLLLIHGMNDDNVVVANTLRLSAALLAAGRPHAVLPLPGVTHAAHQERVAGNLLRLELDFIRRALGMR
jgi:dipeptidyl-peptidase 4